MEGSPPKVTVCSDPGSMRAAEFANGRASVTAPIASGAVPKALVRRRRTSLPVSPTRTTCRTVAPSSHSAGTTWSPAGTICAVAHAAVHPSRSRAVAGCTVSAASAATKVHQVRRKVIARSLGDNLAENGATFNPG